MSRIRSIFSQRKLSLRSKHVFISSDYSTQAFWIRLFKAVLNHKILLNPFKMVRALFTLLELSFIASLTVVVKHLVKLNITLRPANPICSFQFIQSRLNLLTRRFFDILTTARHNSYFYFSFTSLYFTFIHMAGFIFIFPYLNCPQNMSVQTFLLHISYFI